MVSASGKGSWTSSIAHHAGFSLSVLKRPMTKRIFLITFLTWSSLCAVCGQELNEWDIKASQITCLPPTAFPELPQNLIRELQAQQCTVPQTYGNPRPHNVIQGEFARKGRTDWAVLCSKSGVSSILVFWRGSAKNASEIAKSPDKDWLQGIDNGKIGYSRAISAVGRRYIIEHYKAYGGPTPPPIHHEGINDAFVEKTSIVHYYFGGKWLKLQGAD